MKRAIKDNIHTGEYKIKKRSKRLQGKTIKNKARQMNPIAGIIAIGFIVVLFMVSFASIKSMDRFTTYNKFMKDRVSSTKAVEETREYKGMVAMELSSGRVLDAYKENEKLPMASTTKIMTALVVLESGMDLNEKHLVPSTAVGTEGSSMYLKKGENLSLMELLYGLMLPSGNDSAVALSILVSGSESEFANRMNELAEKIGTTSTHFVTASGLHDSNHYTTALDLAKITAYAMKNETFREIVGTPSIKVTGYKVGEPRILRNKQRLMSDEELKNAGIEVTGVKSGFTPEAGRCLVTTATKDDMEIVVVVLNAPDMFVSTKEIIKESFSKFKMREVLRPKTHVATAQVAGSKITEINLYSSEGFSYPLTELENSKLKIRYDFDESLSAPIEKDQIVGEVIVMNESEELYRTPIRAIEEAPLVDYPRILLDIIEDFINLN